MFGREAGYSLLSLFSARVRSLLLPELQSLLRSDLPTSLQGYRHGRVERSTRLNELLVPWRDRGAQALQFIQLCSHEPPNIIFDHDGWSADRAVWFPWFQISEQCYEDISSDYWPWGYGWDKKCLDWTWFQSACGKRRGWGFEVYQRWSRIFRGKCFWVSNFLLHNKGLLWLARIRGARKTILQAWRYRYF